MNRITQADREHKEKWDKRTVPKCMLKMNKIRAFSFALILALLFSLMPTIVIAANSQISISFTTSGIPTEQYDNMIECSATISDCTITRIYIKSISPEDTITVSAGENWRNNIFAINGSTVTNRIKSGTALSDEQMKQIETDAATIKETFSDFSFNEECSKYYFAAFDATTKYGLLILVKDPDPANYSISFTENGIESGGYDSTVSLNESEVGTCALSTLYIKTVTTRDTITVSAGENWRNNIFAINGSTVTNRIKSGTALSDEQMKQIETDAATIKETISDFSFNEECSKYYFAAFDATEKYGLLIQVDGSSTGIDASALKAEIAKVWNGTEYTDNYYTENDRWNGTKAYPKDENNPERGFFWDATEKDGNPLEAALGEFTSQSAVDNALEKLQAAIAKLIPSNQANTTELYERVRAKWYWLGNLYSYDAKRWDPDGIVVVGNQDWVSADNTTSASWGPFLTAVSEAQELYATLFDENGEATDANKPSLNPQIAALVQTVDACAGNLVKKDSYEKYYNYFQTNQSAAESLLKQADPSKLTQSDFTDASWAALTAAWTKLNEDVNYRILGGVKADLDMLIHFYQDFSALEKAYQGLVSDTDITVEFTYVNNFAAKYPALRSAGQDILQMDALPLKNGQTTVQDAVTAAYVQFDSVDIRGFVIPGDINNTSDTSPVYLVYVNGKYMGNSTQTIQLHDNDRVRVVRICKPIYVTEVSTGQSASSNLENPTLDTTYLGDSFATIAMTAPEASKVGDKAAFSATLTGAYGSNVGDARSAGNITLFVSEPYTDETEHFTHQPTTNTGVSTDASGKLEYVFSEPGWYAVAMFSVEDDTPTFTDIYDSTTEGVYPSVYAGDFTFVYVAPSEDEAKLIAQYKAEYAETAKAYFDGFHDYDFADGYYADTFKPQYDALVEHLDDAISYKALKEQFEADFALLKEYGATAIDHQGLVDALREKLSYLPEDITALNSSHAAQVTDIQTAYAAMGAHTKTLLTQAELDRLDRIAAIDVSALPAAAAVMVQIQTIGTLPSKSDSGNPYYGYPNLTWVKTPNLDGTVDYPVWATTYDPATLSAKAGDHVFVRRYLNSTDAQYRLFWSVDDGTTWTSSLPQTLVEPGGGAAYDGYYLVEYIVPKDVADGSTVTIQLKMWSKAEYDANGIESTRTDALAALEAAYSSYNEADYSAENWAALTKAYEDGKTAIAAANTPDAAAKARRDAVAAMAAVSPKTDAPVVEVGYDSGATVGRVQVIVENTTYSDAPFTGYIINDTYALGENDTMMTMILKALEADGYAWNGTGGEDYGITYLSSINKDGESLAEFDGGLKSGWMGTLNDWFTNEGFASFTVADGRLENGDVIHVMYTCDYGADIGGTWNNSDTSLKTLNVSDGTLTPDFSGGVTEYTLVIPGASANVKLSYEAVNKNYQARTYLNNYNVDSSYYKQSETLGVKDGDVIYVGVGERGWASMNGGGKPTKYVIRVKTLDSALDALPDASAVTMSNYKDYQELVETYKAKLNGASNEKLDALEQRVNFFAEIDNVKELLAAVPAADKLTTADKSKVQAAKAAYDKLSEEQTMHISLADIAKYNAAVEWLDDMAAAAAALAKAKDDAIAEVEKAAGENPSQAVRALVDDAKNAIGSAQSVEAVEEAKNAAIGKIEDQQAAEAAAAALAKAKDDAKAAIDEAVGNDTSANVAAAANAAKEAIDAAADTDAVNTAKENGLNAIRSAKDANAAAAELAEAKEAAKEAIDDAVPTDASKEVKAAAETAKKAIDAATTTDAVNTAKENGLDAINDQIAAEELAEAKEAAKEAILAEQGDDTAENVIKASKDAIAAIDAATTVDAVNAEKAKGVEAIRTAKAANKPVSYTIITGADSTWTKGSTDVLLVRSDAPFAKFDSVKVDGSTIAATSYTAEEGSTKITLAPAYLETLSVGTHSIEIVSNDGSASTNFTVKAAAQPSDPTTYKVTFDMGGHGTAPADQTVNEGSKATKPAVDPTAEGWTFGGWYADATFNVAFDFDAAINATTTVYAKWTENTVPQPPVPEKFTVSFNMNGHGTQIAEQTVEDGSKATKPADPTASGYTFSGWYADATFSTKFDFNTAITADTTVYAKWTKNSVAPTDPTSPQTGDNSHMFLWIALLFVSGGALVGTAVYGKKKKYRAE